MKEVFDIFSARVLRYPAGRVAIQMGR